MKKVLIVIAILLLSLILKLHNYDVYPQRGATSDEYTYSFLGLSLLTKNFPESWSNFPMYQKRYDLKIRGIYFPMVRPYFDHPPLNGLLVSSWALLNGQNTYQKIDLKTIRMVPIFLSLISSILVFLIAKDLYDYDTGIFALLIYTTTTIFVMNSRVVLAENLVTPLLLFAIYLYSRWAKFINTKRTIILGMISGLAVLAKELGIVAFLTLLFFFINEKIKVKQIFIFVISFLSIALLYVVYGFYFDKNLFLSVVFYQASRKIGPEVLQMLIQSPIIVNKVYQDGWYFFSWLALFFALGDIPKNKRIVLPFVIYFLLMVISLNKIGEMGWYMIVLFPFMAIASARMIKLMSSKKNWLILIMLVFVGIPDIKLIYENNFGLTATAFRLLVGFIFGPFLLSLLFNKNEISDKLSKLYFYFFILVNIILSYNYIHPA